MMPLDAIVLRKFRDEKIHTLHIARSLGLKESTVYMVLHRALEFDRLRRAAAEFI